MYSFRKAMNSDKDILLEWTNNPLTREMSLDDKIVSSKEHSIWFARSLKKRGSEIYIYEKRDEQKKTPVASVRIDTKGSKNFLSWNVSEAMRNKGVGSKMLKEFVQIFKNDYFAIIKKDNFASMTICSRSGFRKYYSRENITYWKNF
tara:strand:+ start:8205 stop:8645 length:441 start_codon:yes stop_codon:yes gene_type:complete